MSVQVESCADPSSDMSWIHEEYEKLFSLADNAQEAMQLAQDISGKVWPYEDKQLATRNMEFFVAKGGLELIRRALLSANDTLVDCALAQLIPAVVCVPTLEYKVFFSTDESTMDAFAQFLTPETGLRVTGFYGWTLQGLAMNVLTCLAQPFEARKLMLPKLFPLIKAHILEEEKHPKKFAAYIVTALLIGSSEQPQDLDIVADVAVIAELVHMFATGYTSNNKENWALLNVALPIKNLAMNEGTRQVLKQCGLVPHLVEKLAEHVARDNEYVMAAVVGVLVHMCFDKSVAEQVNNEQVHAALNDLKAHANCRGKAQKVVEQALWLLNAPQSVRPCVVTRSVKSKHVMISYSWAQQPLALKLNDILKANGVATWLDVEQMAGSTIAKMAEAVENSSVVLVCMSQRYKESSNCQIEGEYLHVQRKEFIPLLFEHKYRATGWLGALVGSKLWYDCSSEQALEANSGALLRDIRSKMTPADVSEQTEAFVLQPSAADVAIAKAKEKVVVLDDDAVRAWLASIGLEEHASAFSENKMDGPALIELSLLQESNFLQCVKDLGVTKVGEKLKLKRELSQLLLGL